MEGGYGLRLFYILNSCSMTNAITGFDDEYGSLSTVYCMTNIDCLVRSHRTISSASRQVAVTTLSQIGSSMTE